MNASKKHQAETIHRQIESFVGEVNTGSAVLMDTHEAHPAGGATIYFDQDGLIALSQAITAMRSVSKALQATGMDSLEGEY